MTGRRPSAGSMALPVAIGRRPSAGSTALPVALATVAVSLALAAAVAEVSRVEILLARARRSTAVALATTDGCLARGLTALPAGWDFTGALVGGDGVLGTPDDGALVTAPGCAGRLRAAPGPAEPPRALLAVEGQAGGGRRLVEGLVGRSSQPGVPALVWLSEPPIRGAIAGSIVFDGIDPASPSTPAWAPLAAPADPATLDAWVADESPRLYASVGTALPRFSLPPPLGVLTARVQALGPAGPEALVPTGTPPPSVALVGTDLVVPGALHGAGILVVDGTLDIRGSLHFTGVVVAVGGVRIAGGGRLAIDGTLWVGRPAVTGPGIQIDGVLEVHHHAAAIAATDVLFPLPREAVLLGLRDLG